MARSSAVSTRPKVSTTRIMVWRSAISCAMSRGRSMCARTTSGNGWTRSGGGPPATSRNRPDLILKPGERFLHKLRELIAGDDLVVAPVALNRIMARMAEEAGFKALYLSGGSLGWLKCVTEANLTLPELAEVAVDMRAAC